MKRRVLSVVLVVVIAAVSMTALAQSKKADKPEKARDVVCGIMVDKDPALSAKYGGESYYFCSKADMEKFKKDPEKYAKKK